MKPSYWVCGGGSHINCQNWDDINGCWNDRKDAFQCAMFIKLSGEGNDG